jgi:two-component system cell cycle sensor histidine kinase/response regulator CckA
MPVGMLSCTNMVPGLDASVLTRTETILLVEDEAFVREVTVEVLKSAGYSVLTAKTAAEARCLYDQFSGEVDLLLTDVILPDGNGRTLTQELRSENLELAALLVTGYSEQVGMMEAGPPGVECLPKPFSSGTLLERIRAVLDRKRWGARWISGHARLRY